MAACSRIACRRRRKRASLYAARKKREFTSVVVCACKENKNNKAACDRELQKLLTGGLFAVKKVNLRGARSDQKMAKTFGRNVDVKRKL